MAPSTKPPAYSQIHHTNDFDDTRTLNGDAGSDAGDSLIGGRPRGKNWDEDEDEEHHPLGRRGSSRRPCRRWCTSPWLQGVLNVVLVVVVLGLLLERRTSAETTTTTTTTETAATTEYEGSGDITGFIPPVGQQIKTFVPNMSFVPENGSDFFNHATKKMWLSLVPRKSFKVSNGEQS